MIKATAFQMETVKVACHALRNPSGSRRFLVADEAGLGKTVVAQRIIEEFSSRIRHGSKRASRMMNVIYVCSNLAIARQNQDRLLGFLTKAGRQAAIVEEDRLSLTLLPQRSKNDLQVSVRLYAVTPKTSLLDSSSRGRGAGGTTKERALCYLLTRRALGFEVKGLRKALALRVSVARFRIEVRAIEADGNDLPSETVEEFKKALRRSLSLSAKQRLAPRIKQLLDGRASELVRHMRLALANIAISRINPDLVIFDEFQRFDDLIAPESNSINPENDGDEEAGFREEASRLLQSLRGSGRNRALLLLSATPWIPYRSRAEINPKSRNSNDGFGEVVKFLYGSAGRAEFEKITALLLQRRELLTASPLNWDEIDRNHDELMMMLTPVMARTERRRESTDTTSPSGASTLKAELKVDDLKQFKSFHECVEKGKKNRTLNGHDSKRERDTEMLVPLWNSVPLPMQSLGPKYLLWTRARKLASAAGIEPGDVERMRSQTFPHPRLRALIDHIRPEKLALPWIAPSHAWWPLTGGWERETARNGNETQSGETPAIDGKLLVFAKFRAVVPAVAGLISYTVETSTYGKTRGRARSYKRESDSHLIRLDAAASFELFHPSPFLIEADPISDRLKVGSIDEALSRARRTLERHLKGKGVAVVASKEKSRTPSFLIAGIEAQAGTWEASKAAWLNLEKQLPDRPTPLKSITESELQLLAHLAVSSPGVVLGRAVRRHWKKALQENFSGIVSASWKGLRSRFDEPWIARALRRPQEPFPAAIRRAVLDGNLEATLDEHFWFMTQTSPSGGEDLIQEFADAISLNRSSIQLHYGEKSAIRSPLRLRCHVAAPFTRPDHTDEERVRPDEVRRAFNSPFWPHVLVTTSIGQEGLDFHPWCQTLLHWDPPPGPVALEQREGRVDRYASLAIRRAIATDAGNEGAQGSLKASPWENIAKRVVDETTDRSGLQPWWIYRSARPLHLRFDLANSEISERWNQAHEERGHYRLVLGMPNQNDLLGELKSMQELGQTSLTRACLDFSPISRCNKDPE
jgi:hypothetical protein